MTAKDLSNTVLDRIQGYDVYPIIAHHMGLVGSGQIAEVLNESDRGCNLYYQWLACLMDLLKPKQVVELGAAAGISTIMMATSLPKDSKLYSVDIDPQIAWKWMSKDYPQVTKILGDDLNLSIYPKDCDLSQTDIWFFDSLHTPDQLDSEMKLYTPFLKKGAILVFDDVHVSPTFEEVCNDIKDNKYLNLDWCENTIPCHYTGFAVAIVK